MSFRHGKDGRVLLSKYDVSQYLTEVSSSMAIDTAETSTFGTNAKTYITGQNDGTISFSGLWDGGIGALDDIFQEVITAESAVVTIANDGGLVHGAKVVMGKVEQTSYETSMPVGDVVSLNGEFQVTGGIHYGRLLAAKTALTATTNGSAVDNSASTAAGATAILHVTANTRSSDSTIKVQHSADNSVWADLITFTSVASETLTSEVKTVTGTVNRYLRVQTTLASGTGSITITVSTSRRN